MNRLIYLKYRKRGQKVIDRYDGAISIGKGRGGDGVGLRLQFYDANGREIVLLVDDEGTLKTLESEIASTLFERQHFLSQEELSCRQCGAELRPGDDGYGTESGCCERCSANAGPS